MALRIYNEKGELVTTDSAQEALLTTVTKQLRTLISSQAGIKAETARVVKAIKQITKR